jgi:acylphosphatase
VSDVSDDHLNDDHPVRVTAWVRGRVQGVGFRWWVRSRALEGGLVGWARNLDDGRVEVVAEGPRERCERLVETLSGGGSPGRVADVVERWSGARGGINGFTER